MGLFKKRSTDPTEIDRLTSEIAAMSARLEAADRRLEDAARRLDATDAAKSELGEQVRGIIHRLDTPLTPPPDEPPPRPIDPGELAAVRDRLDDLASHLDAVDGRITAISTELAHQIDELSGELESRSPAVPPTDEVVAELRDGQTRLANEQARYQIAFRQDLAALADRLRRS